MQQNSPASDTCLGWAFAQEGWTGLSLANLGLWDSVKHAAQGGSRSLMAWPIGQCVGNAVQGGAHCRTGDLSMSETGE